MREYNPTMYYDLELNIMSCLLQRPELMKNIILEDKHFVKYNRIWKFMKTFYSKYKTFDIPLMVSVSSDKYNLIDYLAVLVNLEPAPSNFEYYQKQLIAMYEEERKNKRIIETIFDLSNELYVRKITISEFKEKVDKILKGVNYE